MRGIPVFIAAIAAIASPAAAADTFDLICSGKDGKSVEEQRYRIDLARKEYCSGSCEKVEAIAEVTSGMITLWDDKPTLPAGETAYNKINRNTGDWEWYYTSRQSYRVQDIKGVCEATAFSGFPSAKF